MISHLCRSKTSFSDITVINHREIKILLFNVYLPVGKQKPPGGIPLGDFCFPIIFNLPISQIFCQIVVGSNDMIYCPKWAKLVCFPV